jgi:FkbM family methyltransferase
MNIKNLIKDMLKHTGYKISKINPPNPSGTTSPLNHRNINLLLDVGANTGQYALRSRADGYSKTIVSFEPLPDAYEKLLTNSSGDPSWIIHERCAIGRTNADTEINVSRNSQSSSILQMLEQHASAAPDSIYIGKEKTRIISIDSIFDYYSANKLDRVFLKVDTQGFEDEVLAGASNSIKRISGIELELSLVPLYEGQYLYRYFLDMLEGEGFYLWAITPGFSDPTTGQQLQIDAIFFRSTT